MRITPFLRLLAFASALTKDLVTSPHDKCTYRHIVLENKLEVLLVYDNSFKKAQVSLDVNVGSMHEPKEYNGLAHFLEHLLFLGNEKYPEEGEFMRFIGSHAGATNAYTDAANTNYHFWIRQGWLKEALDRFSQFFISPSFGGKGAEKMIETSGIMREMNAVDSEYRNIVNSSGFRLHRVIKLLCEEEHPFSRFHVGNLETLNQTGIVEAVKQFYEEHYSANLMKLVIHSSLDLDSVEEMVKEQFSAIPNKNIPPTIWEFPAIQKVGRLVKYKLLNKARSVNYVFGIPGPQPYKTAPYEFLGSLLTNEAEGGLVFKLKQQGLVLEMSSGTFVNSRGFSILSIEFSLTPQGMEKLAQISQQLFSYLDFLRARVDQEEVEELFLEYKQMQSLSKLFEEKGRQYSIQMSSWMQLVEREEEIVMTELEFDPKELADCWSHLTKENVNVIIGWNKFEGLPLKEKFYGIQYSMEEWDLGNDVMLGDFSLPSPNPFIPKDIEFYGKIVGEEDIPMARPELLEDGLWFKMDDSYGKPKSAIFVSLQSPKFLQIDFLVAVEVYLKILALQLAATLEEATMAKIGVEISVNPQDGAEINFSGFSDKLPLLLDKFLEATTSGADTENFFEVAKSQMVKELKNDSLEPSFKRAAQMLNEKLLKGHFTSEQKIAALNKITENVLIDLRGHLKPSMLVIGNTKKETAFEMFSKVKSVFKGALEKEQQVFDWNNSTGKIFWRGPVMQPDSALFQYFPISIGTNHHEYSAIVLLSQILSDEFFNSLRTREQLGYIVQMSSHKLLDSVGIKFVVQSQVDPKQLSARVQKFIREEAMQRVISIEEKELEAVKDSSASALFSRPTSLVEEGRCYWGIITGTNDWFFEKRIDFGFYLAVTPVEILRKEMLNVLKVMSDPANAISIHVWGQGTKPVYVL